MTVPHCRQLVLLGGAAGTGKSTLAQQIAASGWTALSKDDVVGERVAELLRQQNRPTHDRSSDVYFNLVRPVEYELFVNELLRAVQHNNVIADAPWLEEVSNGAWVAEMEQRAHAHGAALRIVWLCCDPQTNRQRLSQRGRLEDQQKTAAWTQYMSTNGQWLRTAPVVADMVLDSTHHSPVALAQQLAAVLGVDV